MFFYYLKEFILNFFNSEFGLDEDQLFDNNNFDITVLKIKSKSLVRIVVVVGVLV